MANKKKKSSTVSNKELTLNVSKTVIEEVVFDFNRGSAGVVININGEPVLEFCSNGEIGSYVLNEPEKCCFDVTKSGYLKIKEI